jgi:hypothetical protein
MARLESPCGDKLWMHAVASSTSTRLQEENDDLRKLVVQLSRIILRNVAEQRGLPKLHSTVISPQLPDAMSPTEIVSRLREVAIRCAHLSNACADSGTATELESLSVELADAAERLETVLAIPALDKSDL